MSTINIQPGTLNLELYGGDDAPVVVNLVNAAGEPATIDGTLKAKVSAPYNTPNSFTPTVTAGSTAGVYTVLFDATLTRAIAGLGVLSWDLQLHNTSGQTRTILKGLVSALVEVTND